MDILQRRFVRVAAGPVAGCHRRSRSRPCTGTRTMSPFKWIHYYFQIASNHSSIDRQGLSEIGLKGRSR